MPDKKLETEDISKTKFLLYSPENISGKDILSETFKTKDVNEEKETPSNDFKSKVGLTHPFNYKTVEGVAIKFGPVNAILDKISDFTIGPGIRIESDDEKIIEILEKWQNDVRFRTHLRPWFIQALMKGSSYLEVSGLGDPGMMNEVKVVDANTVYIKKDEFGNIDKYNQYLGQSITRVEKDKVIPLDKEEIIQFDVNKIGNQPYGYGLIYTGLGIVNDFLGAQKGVHQIMARKANNPIHVKMGSMEHDDYPSQSDIDGYGSKLQYMNNVTEWVTGPNVEMKVIDFGNISDKFDNLLKHDLKLLSYNFQVPETVMGASNDGGINASGHSDNQLDAFERNIKSYQEQLSDVIKYEIFDKVLEANGKLNNVYKVVWGEQSAEDKREQLNVYTQLLSGKSNVSPGLRKEIEKKIALLEDIDFNEMEKTTQEEEQKTLDKEERGFDKQKQLMQMKGNPKSKAEEVARNAFMKHSIETKSKENKAPQEIEEELLKLYPDFDAKKLNKMIEEYFNDE